jgi:hypothetical protein
MAMDKIKAVGGLSIFSFPPEARLSAVTTCIAVRPIFFISQYLRFLKTILFTPAQSHLVYFFVPTDCISDLG